MKTAKERKQIKHSLKTAIDQAEHYIILTSIGQGLGIAKDENASETRKVIKSNLEEVKAIITDKYKQYIEVIDAAIERIS